MVSEEALLGALVLHPNTNTVTIRRDIYASQKIVVVATVFVDGVSRRFVGSGGSLSAACSAVVQAIDGALALASHEDATGACFDPRVFERAVAMVRQRECTRITIFGSGCDAPELKHGAVVLVNEVCYVQCHGTLMVNLQAALQEGWEALG